MSTLSSSASVVLRLWHASSITVLYSSWGSFWEATAKLGLCAKSVSCVGVNGLLDKLITHIHCVDVEADGALGSCDWLGWSFFVFVPMVLFWVTTFLLSTLYLCQSPSNLDFCHSNTFRCLVFFATFMCSSQFLNISGSRIKISLSLYMYLSCS